MIAFSVVVPLYNKRSTVGRALRSVLVQTVQDFEIVVVDDGSTDGSAEVARAVSDPRIRIIHQANAGVSAARNRGIAEAQHELIAFLDADDEWLPEFLSTIRRMVERYPLAGVYATRYYMQSGEEQRPAVLRGLPEGFEGVLEDYFAVACRSEPPVFSSAVCIRKAALQAVGGFRVGITSGEDLLTWARLALQVSIAYSDEPRSVFWLSSTNVKGELSRRGHDLGDPVGHDLAKLYGQCKGQKRKSLKRYLALWHKMRTSAFLRQNAVLPAMASGLVSLRYWPWNPRLYPLLALTIVPRPFRDRVLRALTA